jgi:hypothetical protein
MSEGYRGMSFMKKMNLKMAAVLPLAVVLVGCGRVTIDPNDYLEVEFEGMDSIATADYSIDYEKMVTDNLKAFDIKSKKDEKAIEKAARKLEKYLGGELDNTRKLSNGDTITFEWNDDKVERLEKKYNIKLKISDKTIEVKDLEVPKEFDPFEYLDIEYSGVGDNSVMSLKVDGDLPVNLGFDADKKYGVKNGDKVTVTFGPSYYDEDDIMDACFKKGYKPTQIKKEIKVEGVPSYVEKIDDIEKASYDRMEKYALDSFNELADKWTDKTLVDVSFEGVDMYIPKETGYFTPHNIVCYVYKVTAKNPEAAKEEEKKEEATEAEKTTAAEEATTRAEEKKEEATTTAADDKKKEEAATTTKSEDKEKTTEAKKDDKKSDKKDDNTFTYYYYTLFENVITPDNGKGSDFSGITIEVPDSNVFFGDIYGEGFKKGNVIFDGFETLDKLRDYFKENYEGAKFETNIKK